MSHSDKRDLLSIKCESNWGFVHLMIEQSNRNCWSDGNFFSQPVVLSDSLFAKLLDSDCKREVILDMWFSERSASSSFIWLRISISVVIFDIFKREARLEYFDESECLSSKFRIFFNCTFFLARFSSSSLKLTLWLMFSRLDEVYWRNGSKSTGSCEVLLCALVTRENSLCISHNKNNDKLRKLNKLQL